MLLKSSIEWKRNKNYLMIKRKRKRNHKEVLKDLQKGAVSDVSTSFMD